MVSNESQPQRLDGRGRVAVRASTAIALLWHQHDFDKTIGGPAFDKTPLPVLLRASLFLSCNQEVCPHRVSSCDGLHSDNVLSVLQCYKFKKKRLTVHLDSNYRDEHFEEQAIWLRSVLCPVAQSEPFCWQSLEMSSEHLKGKKLCASRCMPRTMYRSVTTCGKTCQMTLTRLQ